jgi:protein-disulfide isomerase
METEIVRLTLPVSHRDHIQGKDTAPVTLVEYGDYECPYCGQAYPIIKQVQKHFGSKLRFVFRNFPVSQIHPHAQQAAEAAESAAVQIRFWEMHDYLYEHQQALDDKHLEKYASELGLDLAKFKNDMIKHTYVNRVREDFISGVRSGVNGTPTFYINEIRYNDSWDYETLLKTLVFTIKENELADKRALNNNSKLI